MKNAVAVAAQLRTRNHLLPFELLEENRSVDAKVQKLPCNNIGYSFTNRLVVVSNLDVVATCRQ